MEKILVLGKSQVESFSSLVKARRKGTPVQELRKKVLHWVKTEYKGTTVGYKLCAKVFWLSRSQERRYLSLVKKLIGKVLHLGSNQVERFSTGVGKLIERYTSQEGSQKEGTPLGQENSEKVLGLGRCFEKKVLAMGKNCLAKQSRLVKTKGKGESYSCLLEAK